MTNNLTYKLIPTQITTNCRDNDKRYCTMVPNLIKPNN